MAVSISLPRLAGLLLVVIRGRYELLLVSLARRMTLGFGEKSAEGGSTSPAYSIALRVSGS